MKHKSLIPAALLLASPSSAHHSDAGLDMSSTVTVQGTVTEFAWRNPHIYIEVASTDESGAPVEWAFQMGSTITVGRMGWDRDSLQPGERVTIAAHAAVDGRPYGLLRTIEKEGGARLPTMFDGRSAEPVVLAEDTGERASSLQGRWLADADKLVSYPGGFDGFFRAQLTLTERGRAAQAAMDELSFENPESRCLVRPTPGMIVATNLYPLEIEFVGDDIVMIRSEYYDDERTVYMDGRGHPEDAEPTIDGHSIGWWEDDVLVVDTANFAYHRSPYQMGVPSGAQKHVVVCYRLIDDGARMIVEFTLEDPEYLVGALSHSRELVYAPHMTMSRFDCDPEVTRRFVPD